MRDLIVDGVPLRDPLGEWSIDYTASKMLSEVSREFVSDPPYGFHGNPVPVGGEEAYFGTGRESWVINMMSADKDDHVLNLRGFQGLFGRQELTVVGAPQRSALVSGVRSSAAFNVSTDLQVTARCRMVGNLAEERINESTSRLTAIIENLSPFWSSVPYYTSASTPITSGSVTLTLDSTLTDSSAPVVDGLLRIKGPLTVGGTVWIRDRGNAFRGVKYTSTTALGASEYVVIDMATLAARLNTSNVWTLNTGTDVSARVTTSGDGAFYLSPGLGAGFPASQWSYNVVVAAVGYTSGTTAVDIRARRSYFS